ncbi:MAG TPA: hypothetical protein VHF89_02680 [Solirubrobacteraceae bacterium]|nr:hypothetical protein [Solirubrobacteraceae bacterium]
MIPIADNCSGLSDCSFEIKIALAVVALVLVLALASMFVAPMTAAVSGALRLAASGGLRAWFRSLWQRLRSLLRSDAGAPVARGGARTEVVPVATHPLGQWGEVRLAQALRGAGSKPTEPMWTNAGARRFADRIVNGVSHEVPPIAHEAKAGLNVRLTNRIMRQIDVDAQLIAEQKLSGAHWHFFRGATDELLAYLRSRGISYTVYPP